MRENVSGYLHPLNFSRLSWAKLTWSSVGNSPTLSGRRPPEVLSGQHFDDPVLRSGYKENQVLSLPSQLEMLTAAPCLGGFFPFSPEVRCRCFFPLQTHILPSLSSLLLFILLVFLCRWSRIFTVCFTDIGQFVFCFLCVPLILWDRVSNRGLCMSAAQLGLVVAGITYGPWNTPAGEQSIEKWG